MTKDLQSDFRNFPSKVLRKFLETVVSLLSLDDKKSCRLVHSHWKHIVDKQLRHGIILTDKTVKDIKWNERPPAKNDEFILYAMELNEPLSQQDLKFIPKVRSLIFENGPRGQFQSRNWIKKENTLNEPQRCPHHQQLAALPPASSSSSVSTANFLSLLWNCTNLETLQLNKHALALNQLQKNAFKGLYLKCAHLKHLNVVVTGTEELENLRSLFSETFPHLESLSVCYVNISWAENFDVYLEVLIFILKHKMTIRHVDLSDPPMVPRLKNRISSNNKTSSKIEEIPSSTVAKLQAVTTTTTTRNQKSPSKNSTCSMSKLMDQKIDNASGSGKGESGKCLRKSIESAQSTQSLGTPSVEDGHCHFQNQNQNSLPQTYETYLNLFKQEFLQVKLNRLSIYFSENKFSSWGLGVKMIESQHFLTCVILECIPACLAEKVAWNNSNTLKKFMVKGIRFVIMPEVCKTFDCTCFKNAYNLEELIIKEFFSIKNIKKIPMSKVKTLTLLTYMGNDKLYGTAPLCSYETAKWLSENLPIVERLVLFRASMITCALTKKFYKLPFLNEVTFVGFQGQTGCFEVQREGMMSLTQGYLGSLCLLLDSEMTPAQMIGDMSLASLTHSSGKSFIKEKEYKICSEASLCRSCIKILTPKVSKDSSIDRLPKKIRAKIFSNLDRSDLCTCRLVRRSWSCEIEKFLDFGFIFTDKTWDFVCETNIKNISVVAVGNSKHIVPLERFFFARSIKTLVFEFNEDLFTTTDCSKEDPNLEEKGGGDFQIFPEKNITIEKAFGTGREASIKPRNILKLLESTINLETLFLNQWALTNLFGPNRLGIKNKMFTKLAYRNLKNLHLVIHSSEAEMLTQFFNLEFNIKVIVLEKLSIQVVGNPKPRSYDVYESIFKFISNHETISDLKLIDPIVPDSYKGHQRNDVEPISSSILTFIHLTNLTVIFKENSTKWNLGFIFLRAQKYLTEIWLEGLPINEVHTVILNNSSTLKSIHVAGFVHTKKKIPFNFTYTKNCNKLVKLVVKNSEVENTQEVPNSIKILEINVPFVKHSNQWNLSPTLNRVRSKVSVSAKSSRNFLKRFVNLEKIALVHIGAVGVELMTLFLALPNLKEMLFSELHPDLESLLLTSNLKTLGSLGASLGSERIISIEPLILNYQLNQGTINNSSNYNSSGNNNGNNGGRNNVKQGFITIGLKFTLSPSDSIPDSNIVVDTGSGMTAAGDDGRNTIK